MRQNGEIIGFEIEGASDSLCERFSKRRGEIERQIEKFEEKQGRKPTVKEIALITREPAELKEIGTAEVLALQRSQLSPEEWTQLQALRVGSERLTVDRNNHPLHDHRGGDRDYENSQCLPLALRSSLFG